MKYFIFGCFCSFYNAKIEKNRIFAAEFGNNSDKSQPLNLEIQKI